MAEFRGDSGFRLYHVLGMAALFTLFFAESYCYSMLVIVGRYLHEIRRSGIQQSLSYAIFGICQFTGTLVLLGLQALHRVRNASNGIQCSIILSSTFAALCISALPLVDPRSQRLLLLSRSVQGLTSAVFYTYSLTQIVVSVPLQHYPRAIAFMTAGVTLGDGLSPVVGGLLYDFLGVLSAYASQMVVYLLAVASVVSVMVAYGMHQRGAHEGSRPKPGMDQMSGEPPEAFYPHHCSLCIGEDLAFDLKGATAPHGEGEKRMSLRPCDSACSSRIGTAVDGGTYSTDNVLTSVCPIPPTRAWSDLDQVRDLADGDRPMGGPGFNSQSPTPAMNTSGPCPSRQISPGVHEAPVAHFGLLWLLVADRYLFLECCIIGFGQVVRAGMDIMLPMAMMNTRASLIAVVFVGEIVGSLLGPFVVDLVVSRWPATNTQLWNLQGSLLTCVGAALMLVWNQSVPVATFFMAVFGFGQSAVEALTYLHITAYDRCLHNADPGPSRTCAIMSLTTLYFALGYSVGGFIGFAAKVGDLRGQRIVAGVMGGVLLVLSMLPMVVFRRRGGGAAPPLGVEHQGTRVEV